MKYSEAYDKIIQAYFKDEIRPYEPAFCFCGSLAGGSNWTKAGYSAPELRRMEAALLVIIHKETIGFVGEPIYSIESFYAGMHMAFHENVQTNGDEDTVINHINYEDALFKGMVNALEVLKQIHIERGEVIDETPAFTKRQLQPA